MHGPGREVDREALLRHATTLLADEHRLLLRLEQLLGNETDIVNGDDVGAIESIGAERHDCIAALTRLDAERRDACRMHSFGEARNAFARLLEWCDASGELRRRWQTNLDLARRCRDLNERNGAIVMIRLNTVQKLLNSLRGSDAPTSYDPRRNQRIHLTSRELGRA